MCFLINLAPVSCCQLNQEVMVTFKGKLSSMPSFLEIYIVWFFRASVWVKGWEEVQGEE
jgi:hypothetical protein